MDRCIEIAIDRVLSGHLRGVEWDCFYSGRRRAEAQPTGTFTSSQLKAQTCPGTVLHSICSGHQQFA